MSETIKVIEVFGQTVQGEGRNSGNPSVFVRLTSCNLKCPGFGLKRGETNTEIPMIIERYKAGEFKSLDDLPLSKTGCDSYPSSWSQFKDLSPDLTFEQLYQQIDNCCDHNPQGVDLVITGGEPLLKPSQKKLVAFFDQCHDFINRFESLTFETNGTQEITNELNEWLVNRCDIPVVFSISPKLECSGEPEKRRLVPNAIKSIKDVVQTINRLDEVRNLHSELANATMYVKYVVGNEDDVIEALDNANKLGFDRHVDGKIYLMPVGGTYEEYMANQRVIAELSWKYRCVFCTRVHIVAFRNAWKK